MRTTGSFLLHLLAGTRSSWLTPATCADHLQPGSLLADTQYADRLKARGIKIDVVSDKLL